MYVYYEKFPEDKPGNLPAICQIVLSSDGRSSVINFKNKKDQAVLDILRSLFKQVPLTERDYDTNTHIWSFFGFRGNVIIAGIESMTTQSLLHGLEIIEIEDLEEKVKMQSLHIKNINQKVGQKKFKDEDFFYKHEVAVSQQLAGPALITKLAPLLGVSEAEVTNANNDLLKKMYRKAALIHHPDRNNGDGSKMSELNMLWKIFQQV